LRAEANEDLERSVRSLAAELTDLKATLAEVRVVIANDKARKGEGLIDIPNPVSRASHELKHLLGHAVPGRA
jgi:hypothetical protein